MKNKSIETKQAPTPTKAMINLTELFELHTKRINIMEQQFLDLSARVNYIEGSKQRTRSF